MQDLDGQLKEHTGTAHLEEADSYYDPPTFLGDEYNDLLDGAGRTPRPVETPFMHPHASNHVCIGNLTISLECIWYSSQLYYKFSLLFL